MPPPKLRCRSAGCRHPLRPQSVPQRRVDGRAEPRVVEHLCEGPANLAEAAHDQRVRGDLGHLLLDRRLVAKPRRTIARGGAIGDPAAGRGNEEEPGRRGIRPVAAAVKRSSCEKKRV